MSANSNKLDKNFEIIDFNLKGIDDKYHSLSDYSNDKILIIIFMCNHCPYVKAVMKRLIKLQDEFKNDGVRFIGINSNDTETYPEDSFENMKKFADEYKMNFPYLIDETQEVAHKYDAVCTPDIFVFGVDKKLKYHGRIDDNWKEEHLVTKNELQMAIRNILNKEEINFEQLPTIGCSIKWKN